MKKILLTQNKFTLIDDEDFELIDKYKWHVRKHRCVFYAQHCYRDKENKRTKSIQMHRLIMGIDDPNIQIDHINGNGLDNRKCNLRICNNSQNHMNRKKQKNCSSKYKGVSWHKLKNKWSSYIKIRGKLKYLGDFIDEKEAAKKYDIMAIKFFGEFAQLNFKK